MNPIQFSGKISGLRIVSPGQKQPGEITREELKEVLQKTVVQTNWNVFSEITQKESVDEYFAKDFLEGKDAVDFSPVHFPLLSEPEVTAKISTRGQFVHSGDYTMEQVDKTDKSLIENLLDKGARGFEWEAARNSTGFMDQLETLLKGRNQEYSSSKEDPRTRNQEVIWVG